MIMMLLIFLILNNFIGSFVNFNYVLEWQLTTCCYGLKLETYLVSWQAVDTIAGIRLFFPALKAIKHNWALLDRKVNLKSKPCWQ